MDNASALVAERLIAGLAPRLWSFGQSPGEGCHLFLLLKGSGTLSPAHQDGLELKAPSMIWLPAPARGSVQVSAGSEGYRAVITSKFVQRAAGDPILASHRQSFLTRSTLVPPDRLSGKLPTLAASFEALVAESREMAEGAAASMGLHLGVLLLHLWRCTSVEGAHGRSGETTVERFTRLIEMHYRDGLRITDYAHRLGVSTAHLHERCVRLANQTPLALVHDRLMEEARARLSQNELTVEQVGYGLGFRDPGYFNRFFKRLTGQSPGAFQRSAGVSRKKASSSFAAWP